MKTIKLTEKTRDEVIAMLSGRKLNTDEQKEKEVKAIIAAVREGGDKALFDYTKRFDRAEIDAGSIRVSDEEMDEAKKETDPELTAVMERAAENIRAYHEKQKMNSWFCTRPGGIILGQKVTPLSCVGVYVPGGRAAYPSTVLMDIIPAKVAGVKHIVMATPPDASGKVSPVTLTAAKMAGVDEVYKAGGAQAIAALAYGTESIPKVDKIVGPGNTYVALAKRLVYGEVSIDSVAGPTEILIIADETADPRYVAADLLSQAEHDPEASAILITTDETMAGKVSAEVDAFLKELSRRDIIEESLNNNGMILIAQNMGDAVSAANAFAPEHLEILTKDPFEVMTDIDNAGAIFIGEYSCEPLGDYYAGPDHVLPTGGTARFFSPLGVDDYIKKSSVIHYSQKALSQAQKDIETFAMAEGLTAHANSIRVRFEDKGES